MVRVKTVVDDCHERRARWMCCCACCACRGCVFLQSMVQGLSMQQAGWLAHDYVHGRGEACWWSGAVMVRARVGLFVFFCYMFVSSYVCKYAYSCLLVYLCVRVFDMQGCVVNGFSRAWWSEKHNTHHVFPNYVGIDTVRGLFFSWLCVLFCFVSPLGFSGACMAAYADIPNVTSCSPTTIRTCCHMCVAHMQS